MAGHESTRHETAPVQLRSVVELIEVLVVAGAGAVVVGAAVVVVNNLHHGGWLTEVGTHGETHKQGIP